jgi:hypothetical protein
MQAPTPGALNIHKKSIHELIKHPCDQCEHRATTPASLKLHIKARARIQIYSMSNFDLEAMFLINIFGS